MTGGLVAVVAHGQERAHRHGVIGHHARRHVSDPGATLFTGLDRIAHWAGVAVVVALVGSLAAFALLWVLRRRGLAWTWALVGVPLAWIAFSFNQRAGLVAGAMVAVAVWQGAKEHHELQQAGGDLAAAARSRTGMAAVVRRAGARRVARRQGPVGPKGLLIGQDAKGHPARIPVGYRSGSHTLVVGAAGSGKTTTMATKAVRQIEAGFGCIAVDPKGDENLRAALQAAAARSHRVWTEWSPDGDTLYNPYAHGTETELVDKLLAGEEWTEPHYLRQAQRYLGHAIRTLRLTGSPVELATVVDACDPGRLEALSRDLDDHVAEPVQRYLDALSNEQRRDLVGVRDRLAVLAESDVAPVLAEPEDKYESSSIDLPQAVEYGYVVYFGLDSDRRPLASQMVGAAIVQDLIAVCAERQADPRPTLVLIDEFSALDTRQVARLFGRGRSAGLSLVLGTQELADLAHADGSLRDQVAGNIETLIAHRQNVPESADFIAAMAGTRGAWITTAQTGPVLRGQSSDAGTRTRGYEFVIHPDQLKRLPTGTAVIVTPSRGPARTVRIDPPERP